MGAALEMLHTYSLIHDDLPALDNDDLSRASHLPQGFRRGDCHSGWRRIADSGLRGAGEASAVQRKRGCESSRRSRAVRAP